MISSDIPIAESPSQALVSMVESRYGFSVVDMHVSEEEITMLDAFIIDKAAGYHFFGDVDGFAEHLPVALRGIQGGEEGNLEAIASLIYSVAQQVIEASGGRFAWFCLRSALPPDPVMLKRWHMDGRHYTTQNIQYKFCMTLKGPPTRFYLLPLAQQHIRKVLWRNMEDVYFTNEFCSSDLVFRQKRHQGVFFMMAHSSVAAFHAEPIVTDPRLFFSIVPCDGEHLQEIRSRIARYSVVDKDFFLPLQ